MDLKFNAEKNRVFFNNKIDTYDDTHSVYMETKNELTKNLPDDVNNILDLGVGTGLELIELFKRFPNAKVTGIDISEKMIEKLKEREFGDKVKIIQGSFFDVDFGKEYDAVISTSALHHFLKDDKLVLYKKIYDSIKDGGIFINSDKIVKDDKEEQLFIEYYNECINEKPHIDTPLTVEHELEILKESGFKDITCDQVDKDDYRLFKAYKR